MALAVHLTEAGDTLQSVASTYYAVTRPSGTTDVARQVRVIAAIRQATSPDTTDLGSVADDDVIATGSTVLIPTLRAVHRQILTDNADLKTALVHAGYGDARSVIAAGPVALKEALSPLPSAYDAADIARCVELTALFNLDGMDTYTAFHLHDTESITSYEELASQTVLTLDGILDDLTGVSHNRPSELGEQRHSERWPTEAGIYTRTAVSEVAKGRKGLLQSPVDVTTATKLAEQYRVKSLDSDLSGPEARQASLLHRLYEFQAKVATANSHCMAGRWRKAVDGYHAARSDWHRLVEDAGVRGGVDDTVGVNLDDSLAVSKVLLESLPPNEDDVLGLSPPDVLVGATARRFGLRTFRYSELAASGTDRKLQLRDAVANTPVHALPRVAGRRSRVLP